VEAVGRRLEGGFLGGPRENKPAVTGIDRRETVGRTGMLNCRGANACVSAFQGGSLSATSQMRAFAPSG
jgi:hypothetical protein